MTISNAFSGRRGKVRKRSREFYHLAREPKAQVVWESLRLPLGQEGIDLLGRLFPIQRIQAGVEAMLLGDEVGGIANHGLALLRRHRGGRG